MSLAQSNEPSMSTVAPTMTVVETATATITKTITETTTTSPNGIHTGWPTSAIIGIAVTSLVAAVALFVIVGLLYRKRRQHEPSQVIFPETSLETSSEVSSQASPHASRTPSPIDRGTATGFMVQPNGNLLIGASDSDIEEELGSMGLLIQRHVRSFYHRDSSPVTPETLHSSLRQLQLSEATCRRVAELSIDPKTRGVAIRHLLALVIFPNLDVHTVGSLSLLPPTLKELSRSRAMIPKDEEDTWSRAMMSKDEEDILVETAWVSWHRLTAFLMHENPHRGTRLRPPPSVEPQVEALITLLQQYLVHFVRIDDDDSINKQQAGLAGVFRQCVNFGYEVFSHPTDWEFTYPQQEQEQNVVVLPGLLKRSTNEGRLCRPSRVLLPPEIATPTDESTDFYQLWREWNQS